MVAIPVDEDRVGLAQVVGRYSAAFYFSVFERLWDLGAPPNLHEGLNDKVILLALSFDAKVHAGHWQVIGHAEIQGKNAPLPAYLEGINPPGTYEVVDHTGALRRSATTTEVEEVPPRQIVAPVRVEKALRAHHGLEPWLEEYERLRVPPPNQRSDEMFRS